MNRYLMLRFLHSVLVVPGLFLFLSCGITKKELTGSYEISKHADSNYYGTLVIKQGGRYEHSFPPPFTEADYIQKWEYYPDDNVVVFRGFSWNADTSNRFTLVCDVLGGVRDIKLAINRDQNIYFIKK